MRSLDALLPSYEFAERHRINIRAAPARVDGALRGVSIAEIPVARALLWLRGLGRIRSDVRRPFLEQAIRSAVVLDDVAGEGITLGLTGQFWRLRGDPSPPPRNAEEFQTYDTADSCKAVMDFRIAPHSPGSVTLSTETRVHVPDPRARRSFTRYWRVIRPFSGLIRIVVLRAVRRRAEARG